MQTDNDLVFDEQGVFLARQNWEKSLIGRRYPSFDYFLQMFKDGSSCAEIARSISTTRETVRQIYNQFFKNIFAGKTVTEKSKEKKKQEIVDNSKKFLEKLEDGSAFKKLVLIIRGLGLSALLIPFCDSIKKFSTSRLFINGCLCSLHFLKNKFFPREKESTTYSQVHCSLKTLKETEFSIFFLSIDDVVSIYVVPNKVILEEYFDCFSKETVSVYVPISKREKNTKRSKINWSLYKNAWNLISG